MSSTNSFQLFFFADGQTFGMLVSHHRKKYIYFSFIFNEDF